jgi:hypothetical protein
MRGGEMGGGGGCVMTSDFAKRSRNIDGEVKNVVDTSPRRDLESIHNLKEKIDLGSLTSSKYPSL